MDNFVRLYEHTHAHEARIEVSYKEVLLSKLGCRLGSGWLADWLAGWWQQVCVQSGWLAGCNDQVLDENWKSGGTRAAKVFSL